MENKKSDNLSIGDIVSFISILFMGVIVFFGMNFMTLGNNILSAILSVLLFILMAVFVFFAAFAKSQGFNRKQWKRAEHLAVILYIFALIPCYIFSSKFCSIQFGQKEIIQKVDENVSAINRMFDTFDRKCKSRAEVCETHLKSLSKTAEGRIEAAKIIGINASDVNSTSIEDYAETFMKRIKGKDYEALKAEKNMLVQNCRDNFNTWNILSVSKYAADLGGVQQKFAKALQALYEDNQDASERDVPEFRASQYASESNIAEIFKSMPGFSFGGVLIIIFIGGLGLFKYLTAGDPDVIEVAEGSAENIEGIGYVATNMFK